MSKSAEISKRRELEEYQRLRGRVRIYTEMGKLAEAAESQRALDEFLAERKRRNLLIGGRPQKVIKNPELEKRIEESEKEEAPAPPTPEDMAHVRRVSYDDGSGEDWTPEKIARMEEIGGVGCRIDFDGLRQNPRAAARLCQGSLLNFIAIFHRYIYREDFEVLGFHLKIIQRLQEFTLDDGEKKKNLYIGLAPRLGKSIIMRYFMAWCYAFNPNCNFVLTSYAEDLVTSFSAEIMKIVQSDLFFELFGCGLQPGIANKTQWQIKGGGLFRAAPMTGTITGFGAGTKGKGFGGAIVIDDFMKADDYNSKKEKERAINVYKRTLKSRKNTDDVPFIIIAQRLAKDDLIGYIMKHERKEWDFFILPTLQEDGTSLWEKTISAKTLQRLKKQDPFFFYSQYQQNPIVEGGEVIKQDWFRYWNKEESNPKFRRVFVTMDTAIKAEDAHDYTAACLWGLTYDGNLYLIDLLHKKISAENLEMQFMRWITKYPRGSVYGRRIDCIYIEEKATGYELLKRLKRRIRLPLKGLNLNNLKKVERVKLMVPDIAEGYFYLPNNEGDPISSECINECVSFTDNDNHEYDDIVDCFAHAWKVAFEMSGIFRRRYKLRQSELAA